MAPWDTFLALWDTFLAPWDTFPAPWDQTYKMSGFVWDPCSLGGGDANTYLICDLFQF